MAVMVLLDVAERRQSAGAGVRSLRFRLFQHEKVEPCLALRKRPSELSLDNGQKEGMKVADPFLLYFSSVRGGETIRSLNQQGSYRSCAYIPDIHHGPRQITLMMPDLKAGRPEH